MLVDADSRYLKGPEEKNILDHNNWNNYTSGPDFFQMIDAQMQMKTMISVW